MHLLGHLQPKSGHHFQRWPTWASPHPVPRVLEAYLTSLTLRWRRCWWSFPWFWWLPGPVPSPPQKLWRPLARQLPCWAIRHHPLVGGSFQVWQEGIWQQKSWLFLGNIMETFFFGDEHAKNGKPVWENFGEKWTQVFFSTFAKQNLKVSGIGVCHHNKHFKVHAAQGKLRWNFNHV